MFNITKKEMQWGEETLTLETGRVAREADVLGHSPRWAKTSVMANDDLRQGNRKPGRISSPLTVHYQENLLMPAGKVARRLLQARGRASDPGKRR